KMLYSLSRSVVSNLSHWISNFARLKMGWPYFIARTRSNKHVIAHGRKKKLCVSYGKRKNRKSSVRRRRKLRSNGFLEDVKLLELLNERRELLRKSGSAVRKKRQN